MNSIKNSYLSKINYYSKKTLFQNFRIRLRKLSGLKIITLKQGYGSIIQRRKKYPEITLPVLENLILILQNMFRVVYVTG